MQQEEVSNLTEEEMKLLQDYRSGRLLNKSSTVVHEEDLAVLNGADSQIKKVLYELGMLEEHKGLLLKALQNLREQKNNLLQEVMLKYGIPANQPFKINRDTGSVDFNLEEPEGQVD